MWQTTKKTFLNASENENGESPISPVMCSTFLCFSCRHKAEERRKHAAYPGEQGRLLGGRSFAAVEHPLQSLQLVYRRQGASSANSSRMNNMIEYFSKQRGLHFDP